MIETGAGQGGSYDAYKLMTNIIFQNLNVFS